MIPIILEHNLDFPAKHFGEACGNREGVIAVFVRPLIRNAYRTASTAAAPGSFFFRALRA